MIVFGHRLTGPALFGFTVIALYLVCIAFAPWLARHGEAALVGDSWMPPSAAAWLGTDSIGRDLWSRLLYGGRTTVGLALIATTIAFVVGIVLGFGVAIAPRWIDMILSRFVDTLMAIPQLIMALVVLSVLGTSIPALIGTIALLDATRVFRLSRAVAMEIVVLEYVEVSKLRGEGLWWIIRREILPNAVPPLVVEFGYRFCYAFLFIASLSFLGLGIQPPHADWGSMVRENATAINLGSMAPLIPAATIALLTISVNLVVDWFLSIQGESHGESA